jgi:uncharacterized protein (TIGR02466 family)
MMRYEMFFPVPMWWEDTDLDNDPILDFCLLQRTQDPVGRKLSNQGGWQSKDFRPGTHPALKELEEKIITQAEQCIRDYGYVENQCHVFIGNMWININGKDNTNSVHIHDNSFISGAYYVKARPGQGNINFYRDHYHDYSIASQAPIDHYTPISASAISYPPITKRLMLFPGSLPHGVERNELDEDRISISFNVRLIRKDDEFYWAENLKRN